MRLGDLVPEAGGGGPAAGGWMQVAKYAMRPTGAGDLEGYRNHPVALKPTDGWARIARGLTGAGGGIAGSWLVDVCIGIFQVATGG